MLCGRTADDASPPPCLDRHRPRRRHGAHGDRPRARLLGCACRGSDARSVLHPMGHAFLRAGFRVSGRNLCVPVRCVTGWPIIGRARIHFRVVALSGHAWTAARAARADGHPRVVDVQRRLLAVHPGRRHLDAGLVHGPAGGDGLASDLGDRGTRPDRHRVSGCVRRAGERDACVVASDLGVHLSGRRRGQAWRTRPVCDGALHHRAVDRSNGRRICVWRDHVA